MLLCSLYSSPRTPLDDSVHVRSAAAVVATLAPKIGKPVAISRELRAFPMLVEEGSLTPAQALEDLAFALHASVLSDGNTLRIERTAADRKALQAVHVAILRKSLVQALGTWDARLKQAAALGDVGTQVRKIQEQTASLVQRASDAAYEHREFHAPPDLIGENMVSPAGRLLRALLLRCGTAALADLGPDRAKFLSDHPGQAESTLPDCGDLLAEYVRERATVQPTNGGFDAQDPPSKIVLRVNEESATVNLYDTRGKLRDSGWMSHDMEVFASSARNDPGLKDGPDTSWAPLDDASIKIRRWSRAPSAQTPPEAYLHPEAHDPLDFEARAAVRSLPRPAGSHGFVALLSDDVESLADASVSGTRVNVTGFARLLLGSGGFEQVIHKGATILRPGDPLSGLTDCVDREALGRGIRRIFADREFSLRNWSALQLGLFPNANTTVAMYALIPLRQLGFHEFSNPLGTSSAAYAILGAAFASGQAASDGGSAPFAEIIRDGVVNGSFAFKGAPDVSDLSLAPSTLLGSDVLRRATVLLSERSETTADRTTEASGSSTADLHFHGMNAEQIGGYDLFAGLPTRLLRSTKLMQSLIDREYFVENYRLGQRTTTTAEIRLPTGLSSRISLADEVGGSKVVPFDGLPQEFKDSIHASIERNLKSAGSPP